MKRKHDLLDHCDVEDSVLFPQAKYRRLVSRKRDREEEEEESGPLMKRQNTHMRSPFDSRKRKCRDEILLHEDHVEELKRRHRPFVASTGAAHRTLWDSDLAERLNVYARYASTNQHLHEMHEERAGLYRDADADLMEVC